MTLGTGQEAFIWLEYNYILTKRVYHSFNIESKDAGKLSCDSLGPEIWTFSVTETKGSSDFFRSCSIIGQRRASWRVGSVVNIESVLSYFLSAPEHCETNRGKTFAKTDTVLYG